MPETAVRLVIVQRWLSDCLPVPLRVCPPSYVDRFSSFGQPRPAHSLANSPSIKAKVQHVKCISGSPHADTTAPLWSERYVRNKADYIGFTARPREQQTVHTFGTVHMVALPSGASVAVPLNSAVPASARVEPSVRLDETQIINTV